jgi:hypothetical protein
MLAKRVLSAEKSDSESLRSMVSSKLVVGGRRGLAVAHLMVLSSGPGVVVWWRRGDVLREWKEKIKALALLLGHEILLASHDCHQSPGLPLAA